MPTIHDLPLETIGRIVDIAYPASSMTRHTRRERNRFLKAMSLVRREWTPFVQEALWLDVAPVGVALQSFLAAGPRRHPVRRLQLSLPWPVEDSQTEAILWSVRGVRELTLQNGFLSIDLLCGDNFKDLKSLTLHSAIQLTCPVTPTLPFNLTTLDLSFHEEPSSFQLLDALSHQSSITSLELFTGEIEPAGILRCLARLGPQLVTLKTMWDYDSPAAAHDFLKRCTRLKHLTIDVDDSSSISRVVVPLESFSILGMGSGDVDTILDVLDSDWVAVSKLGQLEMPTSTQRGLRTSPRWPELEQRCREKKIKLITSVDK